MASNGPITPQFFGFHCGGHNVNVWPTLPIFGSWRSLNQVPGWISQQPTQGIAPNFGDLMDGTGTDSRVNAALAKGAEVILTLAYTPTWASLSNSIGKSITGSSNPTNVNSAFSFGSNSPPQNMQYWIDYVTAVGTYFLGRVHVYEIWNEVNDPGSFSGTIGGANDIPSAGLTGYAATGSDIYQLTKTASIILKSIDPTVKIISPTMVGGINSLVPLVRDLVPYIDIIGHHFYTSGAGGNSGGNISGQFPGNELIAGSQYNDMMRIRKLLTYAGVPHTLPIWNTEFGFAFQNADSTGNTITPNVPEGDYQVGFAMQSYLIAAACGVDRNYWYAWEAGDFALIEPSTGSAGPTNIVYKAAVLGLYTLKNWLIGRYVSDIIIDEGTNISMVQVTGPDGFSGLIMWNNTSATVYYQLPKGYRSLIRFGLLSNTLGNNSVNGINAGPPSQDIPLFDQLSCPNPISLYEGHQYISNQTYNPNYSTTVLPNKYRNNIAIANTDSSRTQYATTHLEYSGWGLSTSTITPNEFVYLDFTPILLLAD